MPFKVNFSSPFLSHVWMSAGNLGCPGVDSVIIFEDLEREPRQIVRSSLITTRALGHLAEMPAGGVNEKV